MNTTTMNMKDIVTANKYDWTSSDINEKNFPPETLVLGSEPKLYHFNRNIASASAIAQMYKDGYRPGTLGDLLDFGAKNLEEQRKYPIIALGSVALVDGDRCVACLDMGISLRSLFQNGFGNGWGADHRFLGVRK